MDRPKVIIRRKKVSKSREGQTGGGGLGPPPVSITPQPLREANVDTVAPLKHTLGQMKGQYWSITINNPTAERLNNWKTPTDPRWRMEGQYEEAPTTGTPHLQLKLYTHQCRGTEIKRAYPDAHIELAKNKWALRTYVHKQETRIEASTELTNKQQPLNIFTAQTAIASILRVRDLPREYGDEMVIWMERNPLGDFTKIPRLRSLDDYVAAQVKEEVKKKIEAGENLWEIIAINPMWLTSWKTYGLSILKRSLMYNNAPEPAHETLYEAGSSEEGSSRQEDESP